MTFTEKLRNPEDMADRHLVAFIVQLVVIIGVILAFFKLFMVVDESAGYGYHLDSGDTFISSVMTALRAEEGEEKLLREIPTLNMIKENVTTDKFIDIENHGLWLTEKQDIMFSCYLVGMIFANIILVLSGAGPIYRRIRSVLGVITREMCPLFILVIPFGIWGFIMCAVFYVTGFVSIVTAPFALLYHLIMGIIQTVLMIKDR